MKSPEHGEMERGRGIRLHAGMASSDDVARYNSWMKCGMALPPGQSAQPIYLWQTYKKLSLRKRYGKYTVAEVAAADERTAVQEGWMPHHFGRVIGSSYYKRNYSGCVPAPPWLTVVLDMSAKAGVLTYLSVPPAGALEAAWTEGEQQLARVHSRAVQQWVEQVETAKSEEASLLDEGVVCTQRWEALPLQCALSRGRLVYPAKGVACQHLSRCNYKELRDYVGRCKQCPIAGCNAHLKRTRDVERDDNLAHQLQLLLDEAITEVWVRDSKVRSRPPESSLPKKCPRRMETVILRSVRPSVAEMVVARRIRCLLR